MVLMVAEFLSQRKGLWTIRTLESVFEIVQIVLAVIVVWVNPETKKLTLVPKSYHTVVGSYKTHLLIEKLFIDKNIYNCSDFMVCNLLWTCLICCAKKLGSEKFFPQKSHLNGLSVVCTRF